jgi:hypothetical protein
MAIDRVRLAGALKAIAVSTSEIRYFPERLCAACVSVLPVDGLGLSLVARGQSGGRALLGASDAVGARIEQLQFELGEGPCVSAFENARPVLVPDLQDAEPRIRWPMFARESQVAGAGSLFAFPLQVGAIGIGVLDCYRSRVGPLEEIAEALAVADTVTMALINIRAGIGLEGQPVDLFDLSWRTHAIVHQATGALAAQLRISTEDALARLRAYAFLESRPLDAVARDLMAGELHIS